MLVQQISVFVENKNGRLADITRVLQKNNIDISAISIADTANFGILRMIVNKPQEAVIAIRNEGYTVNTTDVLAVEVDDSPGGLNKVLEIIDNKDISVEYLYSFVRRPSKSALILFRVEEPDKVVKILKNAGIHMLNHDEVYML